MYHNICIGCMYDDCFSCAVFWRFFKEEEEDD